MVEGAQWRFNGFKLPLTNEQQQQGIHEGAAKAYVRPHQWRLSRSNDAGAMLHGFLKEVQDLGPLVRLHVLDEEQAQAVDVFVPQQIQQQAAYQKGERVSLSPEAVTLFNA